VRKNIIYSIRKDEKMKAESVWQKARRIYQDCGIIGLIRGMRIVLKLIFQRGFDRYGAFTASENAKFQEIVANAKIENGLIETNYMGSRLKLLAKDTGVTRQILVRGIREKSATLFLERLLKGRKTILRLALIREYIFCRKLPARTRTA
jgi:hypothetical protein